MAIPQSGSTHDIVIHVNDSVRCGLIVWPHSYHVGYQEDFLPRLSQGDPTGLDMTMWKSFVQQSFFQGAGQYFWSSAHANAGFAESKLFDIGRPVTIDDVVLRYDPSWAYGENLAPTGQLQVAVMPNAMTAGCLQASQFSTIYPVHLFEMSANPHIIHNKTAMTYTAHAVGRTWVAGLNSPSVTGLSGKWSNIPTFTSLAAPVVSATQFTGIVALAHANRKIQLWGPVLDTVNNKGALTDTLTAIVYTPWWSTTADKICVYDEKLWRTDVGRVAYLTPGDNTTPWSAYYTPGKVDVPINNMCEFGGRLFFGYEDGLAVFDAGQVYIVQSFAQQRDASNFKLMINHYGALYFNIQGRLYRYTGAGVIELIRTPIFTNNIVSGVSIDDELIFIVGGAGTYQIWIYNADNGGVYMWFEGLRAVDADIVLASADTPNYINALRGRVFIAPMYLTGTVSAAVTTKCPIIACSRWPSSDLRNFGGARLVTSSFDMGLPSLEKQYNRVVVDHRMDSGSHIDVDISITARQLPRLAGAAAASELIAAQHSLITTYNVPTYMSAGQQYAVFQAAKSQQLEMQGAFSVSAQHLTARLQVMYTISNGWGYLPDAKISGNRTSYDIIADMEGQNDWTAWRSVPGSSEYLYGIRARFLPYIATGDTMVLSASTFTTCTVAVVLRVDGSLVVDGDSLVRVVA